MDKLNELVEVSRFYGNDPMYILAGGGNTSFKNDEKIWIKASGSSMADIDQGGFVCLSRSILQNISTKEYSDDSSQREADVKTDLYAAILYPENKRPSVETSMHNAIEFPFIVHTHPTLVNSLMCAKNSKEITQELFGDQALYIEYTDPGYVLFKKVEAEIVKYRQLYSKEPAIIFLQNHGVFVGGDTVEEIKNIYQEIEQRIKDRITNTLPSDSLLSPAENNVVLKKTVEKVFGFNADGCVLANSELISSFTKSLTDFKAVNKPFTPDDIVYCKSNYVYSAANESDMTDSIKSFKEQRGYFPKVIAIDGGGLLIVEDNQKSAETVRSVFENMMKVSFFSENFGGPQFMSPEQISFIDNWEVENYRRQIAKQG